MIALTPQQKTIILDLFQPIIKELVQEIAPTLLPTIPQEPKYYTRKEVCNILHITLPTLGRLTKDGILNSVTIGSRVLYEASTIDAALSNNKSLKYKKKAQPIMRKGGSK